MRKFLSRVKSVSRDDSGDFVLVFYVLSILVMLFPLAIFVDLTKNSMVYSDITTKAQHSSSVSIKTLDTRGSLNWDSAVAFADEYEYQRYGYSEAKGYNEDSMVSARFDRAGECESVVLDNGKKVSLPYYEFRFVTERGDKEKEVATRVYGTNDPRVDYPRASFFKQGTVYRSLEVTLYDSSPNVMTRNWGFPCQDLKINVSSISFGSDSDL